MKPVIDPRRGDVEDDASSSKRRSLLSLAGSLLAEISLPKLLVAWFLLIVGPGLVLGVAPVVAAIWVSKLSTRLEYPIAGIWPLVILAVLVGVGWFGGRTPPSPEMPLKMRPTGLSSGFYSAWRSDSWSFRALRCPRVSGW